MSFFSDLFSGVGSFFGGLFSQAAKTTTAKLAEGLSDLALTAVKEVNAIEDASSAEKWQLAKDRIVAEAQAQGAQFTTSAVNMAIELAFAVIQETANQAAQAVPRPAPVNPTTEAVQNPPASKVAGKHAKKTPKASK